MIDINKIGSSNMEVIRESFPEELEREYEKLLPLLQRYNFLVTSIHAIEGETPSHAVSLESSSSNQGVSESQKMLLKLKKRQMISKIKNQVEELDSLIEKGQIPKLDSVQFSDAQKKSLEKNLKQKFYGLSEESDTFIDSVFLEKIFPKYAELFSSYLELKKSILSASLTMAQGVISGELEKIDFGIFDADIDSQFPSLDERITSIMKRVREGSIMIYIHLEIAIEHLTKYNLLFSQVVRNELDHFDFDDLEGSLCTNHFFRDIYFSIGGETFQAMALNQVKSKQELVAEEIVQEMKSGTIDIVDGELTSLSNQTSGVQKTYS